LKGISVTKQSASALIDDFVGIAAHLDAELEEALAEHRLRRSSFLVLRALAGAEGGAMSQRELVGLVRRTSGTMSVRLGRLERFGVIEREQHPDDRRSVTVTLTERGRKLVEAAAPAYDERAERLAAALGDGGEGLAEHVATWRAFFEPGERDTPRLGVVVAPAAVAARMRRAVGLDDVPGVLVLRVRRGGAADKAGISRGDLFTEAAGEPVRSVGDLERALRRANGKLKLAVLRGAEPREVEVALGAAE
jgi:DNA-binding MarR family transcriptional regulator